METILGILIGLGLAASCGFRVFVPPLIISIASLSGYLELSESFAWMGTYPALIGFASATVLEIAGHYIPVVDNILNVIASPAAVMAGILVTAAVVTDMNPLFTWSLAIIAGGGIAAIGKGVSGSTRITSTITTAGVGNPLVTTLETIWSFFLSIISIVIPIVAGILVLVMLVLFWKLVLRRFIKKATP